MYDTIPIGALTQDQVSSVLRAAIAAPSLHNSQPWRLVCTRHSIELHADFNRALPAADPQGRALMLACGAALLNMRVAIRAAGIQPTVRILPNASEPTLVATVSPDSPAVAHSTDLRLAAAIPQRHTNRRPFLDEPVPDALRDELHRAARLERSWMAAFSAAQLTKVRRLLLQAHHVQINDPEFVQEWRQWTGRPEDSADGVRTCNSGPLPEQHDMWTIRDFSAGTAHQRVTGKDFESEPLIVGIGSFGDIRLSHVHAGQAMQRLLLTATAHGVAASFLSQLVEVPAVRHELRAIMGGVLYPQTVLRLGYGSPAPHTLRRELSDVVSVCDNSIEVSHG